ncbi:MAG: hypothetical protein R2710_14625 [Acidimicrobiales bacterium]
MAITGTSTIPVRAIGCSPRSRWLLPVTTAAPCSTGGQAALAISPDHAAMLAASRHTQASVAEAVVRTRDRRSKPACCTGSMGRVDPEREYACFASPDDLLLFVAGGSSLYSTFPSWCAGPHRNQSVTVEIELDQACARCPGPTPDQSARRQRCAIRPSGDRSSITDSIVVSVPKDHRWVEMAAMPRCGTGRRDGRGRDRG